MLLAIDIGNTTIGIALMRGRQVSHSFRLMTTGRHSSDEIAVLLRSFIAQAGCQEQDFDSAVVASVVPALTSRVCQAAQAVTGSVAHLVSPRHASEYGILLDVRVPGSVGADIIADCVGADSLYSSTDRPTLVLDCGTATKYILIDSHHRFSRLAIGLGIEVGTRSLTDSAAQLPSIELTDPGSVLGRDTLSAMQAGLYYGFLGSIDYTLRQFTRELGDNPPRIVATGGLGGVFSPVLPLVDQYDPDLLYTGLAVIDERVRPR